MPTTTIETPVADPRFARRVAKELAFWWRRHGVDVNHAVTRFVDLPGDRVFSGPFPLAGRPGEPAPAFAFVTCVLSRDRDAGFRRGYARHLRDVLAPEIPADRVFVSFQPTDPADHLTPGSPAWDTEPEEHQ
ncbi:hypothetical protein ACNTMW_01030 [Planosporangium sp. 12N6]|uniref:hypothetical protein n=1 Tax=Planosporangium spinosum TaxID=3402278 RepID=UPI003CFA7283